MPPLKVVFLKYLHIFVTAFSKVHDTCKYDTIYCIFIQFYCDSILKSDHVSLDNAVSAAQLR